jgi:nitrous oxidase accessory protein NosD
MTVAVAVVVATGGVGSLPAAGRTTGPTGRPDRSGTAVVPCSQRAERTNLTGGARLDPSCAYTGGFVITASDVTLDCRGATIRGPGDGHGIDVQAPTTEPLHGIHIRNCRVEGFLNGIQITRLGFVTLAAGVEYANGFSDISVEDSRITGNTGVGVYVDGYVTGVTIRHDDISANGSSGIYLDTGSKDNVVADNQVHGNGFVESGPAGTDVDFMGLSVRYWGPGREGLSLDGSRHNRVVGNRFWGNSAGSIFLYKNCGEYYITHAASWLPRRYGSDGNVIEGNVIAGGLNGVWVASRMGENTYPMECSAPAYYQAPLERVVEDEATDNVVRANVFSDVTYAVHVEDDRTTVEGNAFFGSDATHYAVIIGTRLRTTALDHPVTGTRLVGNASWIDGNASPYRWVDGQSQTVVARNTARHRGAGICQAPEVPHNFMIMMIAFGVEQPGQPPPAPPDLTVPTLGALPACR